MDHPLGDRAASTRIRWRAAGMVLIMRSKTARYWNERADSLAP
jgi:hypothetical protein